jgi:hypothetical protein
MYRPEVLQVWFSGTAKESAKRPEAQPKDLIVKEFLHRVEDKPSVVQDTVFATLCR